MGTVHGHSLVHDICLLWVDAHADINTPVTSLSGKYEYFHLIRKDKVLSHSLFLSLH